MVTWRLGESKSVFSTKVRKVIRICSIFIYTQRKKNGTSDNRFKFIDNRFKLIDNRFKFIDTIVHKRLRP